MLIVVDDREPPTVAARCEALFSDAMVTTERLRVGDIRIGPLTVERKTGQDFINSWFSGHLQQQIADLLATTKRPILMVHGEGASDSLHKDEWARIMERVGTINLALPTYVFDSLDEGLLWLANRVTYLRSGEWVEYVKRPVRVAAGIASPVIELYAGLPHIGPELAGRLAAAYPTPRQLTDALADPRQLAKTVDGIGARIATCLADVWVRGSHPHSPFGRGGGKATSGARPSDKPVPSEPSHTETTRGASLPIIPAINTASEEDDPEPDKRWD